MTPIFGKLTHCVYILYSEQDDHLYTGYSACLRDRLTAHFEGKVESTAARRPLRLIHVEYYLAETDARRREQYLKSTRGKRALQLMCRDSLAEVC